MKNNILDENIKNQACTGCSICSTVCPTTSISIKLTRDGFYEPVIDEKLCIECGLCKKRCYKFDENILEDEKNNYKSYSAINKDEEELRTSTSGGVSIELMKECINQGYSVVGVAYDYEKDIAVTKITSELDELEQFKGSKYFQSYTIDAFDEIIKDKSNKKYAIFGTPCQIYAISKCKKFKKNSSRILLIDLFCHGCPSLNLWTKYINYTKQKLGVSKFKKIEFRSKAHGWHEYCNTYYIDNKKIYNSPKTNDMFYDIFFDKHLLNKACYNCRLRSTLRYTDIRLGDFWGTKYDTDVKGVSAVIACTSKGEKILQNISKQFIIKEHYLSEITKWQSYGKIHNESKQMRDFTFKLLSSECSIKEIIKKYRQTYPMMKKIKVLSKSIIKSMPTCISKFLRKFMHSIN